MTMPLTEQGNQPDAMPYQGLALASNSDLRPLSVEESHAYMLLAGLSSKKSPEEAAEEVLTEYFPAKILAKRLEFHKIPHDKILAAFVSLLCTTPAHAVMWAHYLHYLQKKIGKVPTLGDFSLDTFCWGVPTDDFLNRMWDGQKSPDGNNRLDYEMELWS